MAFGPCHDSEGVATGITERCLLKGLLVRQTQGRMIGLFPALTITEQEMEEGLAILGKAVEAERH